MATERTKTTAQEDPAQTRLRTLFQRAIERQLGIATRALPNYQDVQSAETPEKKHDAALRIAAESLPGVIEKALKPFTRTEEAEAYKEELLAGASLIQTPQEKSVLAVTATQQHLRLMQEGYLQKHVDMEIPQTPQEKAHLAGATLLVNLAQAYLA